MSEDRYTHFLGMVGNHLHRCRLAGLAVYVALRDGTTVAGIPEPHLARGSGADSPEVDDTGFARALAIGGQTIALDHVHEIRVRSPDAESGPA